MLGFKEVSTKFRKLKKGQLEFLDEPFILSVEKKGVNFEFLIRVNKSSDKAIALGSGAYDATSDLNPPIFQRHKWMKHFGENLIYYNDPTLYAGQINIGWGFGDKKRHYLSEIAEIIDILLSLMGIDRKKTLFYGSSAAGYMSLMLGGFLQGSSVLVNNPQTIVWNYYDRHVNSMFKATLPKLTREQIIERYPKRLNVAEFYKDIEYVPPIRYLQNLSSTRDVDKHMNPFFSGIAGLEDRVYSQAIDLVLYANAELGHSPLSAKDSLYYINKTLDEM
ncbi:hypothetical protein J416_01919 [Gracilibacillus halophilus YIM-C55.5]|uniref:Uncharacterized protein n=1 Tax=Gracilibacillus halophilus YIM-C55.5 TaxID=1308866 RepID=N4WPR2_9BACI|nr:hypothetical protein [Gracilibacillus halophilus]ENH98082.1 hypothetical protein J416_01919 [Gracilibacillus halophilus YIM-C55.5]